MTELQFKDKYKIGSRHCLLTIIEHVRIGNRRSVKCRCACGNDKLVKYPNRLVRGCVKSCGCQALEAKRENGRKRGGQNTLPPGEAAFNALFNSYRAQARYRKLVFSVTKNQFKLLTKKPCHYCGEPPSMEFIPRRRNGDSRDTGNYNYSGLDRVDSRAGYTACNIVPCCKYCNRAKRDGSAKDLKSWLKRVVERH